jgi:hypothetical protein
MRAAINLAGGLLYFPLQVLVITRLLRGDWRRFPVIFAFLITDFLVAVAEFPTVWTTFFYRTAETLSWRAAFYERGEILLEFLNFLVVLDLIYRATAHLQSRKLMRAGCVAGAILFVGISFAIHYNPDLKAGLWMTPWTRDLNVCTVILDLALWMLLLAQRRKDQRLLLLSGALGIQYTGSAIGNSLRTLASRQHPWPSLTGGTIVVASVLIRVYLWARAFRPVPQSRKEFALDVPSES